VSHVAPRKATGSHNDHGQRASSRARGLHLQQLRCSLGDAHVAGRLVVLAPAAERLDGGLLYTDVQQAKCVQPQTAILRDAIIEAVGAPCFCRQRGGQRTPLVSMIRSCGVHSTN